MSSKDKRVLGQRKSGLFFVISAPAGTGKTTLVDKLLNEFSCIKRSVTCTTRKAREGEVDGEHYHFISQEEFDKMAEEGAFLEYVSLFEHSYGTPKEWILDQENQGNHVVLVIDTQGAMKLKGKLDATFIFISPPSIEELRTRMLNRRTESPESIERRLNEAERELSMLKLYDYNVINDDLDIAYEVLRSIFVAEEHKV
ncbi:MAG: guanylate kinase [Chlamydiales bacterium]|jgi:guanylate kinase